MSAMKAAVRYAVAVAVAGAAANSASALDVSGYPYANQVTVYLSGSTALDNTLTNAAIQDNATQPGLCVSGTTTIYLITSSTNTQKLILCTASSAAGSGVAGNPLAIFKESVVGSSNGVQPLINVAKSGVTSTAGTYFITPSLINDTNCGPAVVTPASGDFGAFTTYGNCPTSGAPGTPIIVPTGGFSDVEAAILKTAGNSQVSAADATTYLNPPVGTVDQVWGVPVTKTLYYALQDAEGLTSSCPASYTQYGSVVTGTPFIGRDSPSCAPSLTKSQVSGILTAAIVTGTQLGVATNATDDNLYLCRRDIGSGTEASYEYLFIGQRCSLTGNSIQSENAYVWANSSAGSVRNCLKAFNAGGTVTHYYPPNDSFSPSAGSYALGFANTEVTAANLSGASDGFRMVAVDGIMPQIANVENGTYPYFSTGAAYSIKAAYTGHPTGAPLTAFTTITHLIGHPLWTADSNTNYSANPWGVTGDASPAPQYAASFAPTLPATHITAAANPTNAFTKAFSGPVNNCDVPQFDSVDLPTGTINPVESKLLGTGRVNN